MQNLFTVESELISQFLSKLSKFLLSSIILFICFLTSQREFSLKVTSQNNVLSTKNGALWKLGKFHNFLLSHKIHLSIFFDSEAQKSAILSNSKLFAEKISTTHYRYNSFTKAKYIKTKKHNLVFITCLKNLFWESSWRYQGLKSESTVKTRHSALDCQWQNVHYSEWIQCIKWYLLWLWKYEIGQCNLYTKQVNPRFWGPLFRVSTLTGN